MINFLEKAEKYSHLLSKDDFIFIVEKANVKNCEVVKFCAKEFTIEIYYNSFAYEIETIYLINKTANYYNLYDVFQNIGFEKDNIPGYLYVANEDTLENYFHVLTNYLKDRYCYLRDVTAIENKMTSKESSLD